MLSYRHGFHAGNHADVLKHWLLTLCLQYLIRKDKPLYYLDTHAGAGSYDLRAATAARTGEAALGIGRLQGQDLPAGLAAYRELVVADAAQGLRYYPGSPQLAARLLRPQDRLRLLELHPTELTQLRKRLGSDPRVKILDGDGFTLLKGLLPPPSRRGLVLLDPSYELKGDYRRMQDTLRQGLERFATGVYLLWYPLLNLAPCRRLSQQLEKLPAAQWLQVQLQVQQPPAGHGMYGSGVFIINPPWTLRAQLEQELPVLLSLLAQDDSAQWRLWGSELGSK